MGTEPRKYRIVRQLGQDQTATVYEVSHRIFTRQRLAIKVLKPELPGCESELERWRQGAIRQARVEHPHVVRVLDIEEDEGFGTYMVMELVDGQSLRDMLKSNGPLPYADVLRIGAEIASALDAVHRQNIVHGNVRAEKILIEKATGKALLIDFSLASDIHPPGEQIDDETSTVYIGTPRYACPERLRLEPVDPRWDIYAMGAVLYESFSGRIFLHGLSQDQIIAAAVNPHLRPELSYSQGPPEDFERLVADCLAGDPQRRLASAAELARRLEQCKEAYLLAIRAAGNDRLEERAIGGTVFAEIAAALGERAPADGGGVEPNAIDPAGASEDMQFTVYRPDAIIVGRWYALLAFAHLGKRPLGAAADDPDPIETVKHLAETRLGEALDRYDARTADSVEALPRGGEITFVPQVPGIEFNPPRQTLRWLESVHMVEFRLRANRQLRPHTARGRLSAFWGVILLADIPLVMRIDEHEDAPLRSVPLTPVPGRVYNTIFASYSRKDAAIVAVLEDSLQSLGHRYLRDTKDLRAGEVWSEGLRQLIADADVFQLFWSHQSMRSQFVRAEWEYALSLDRPGFVRPTFWENPFPQAEEEDLPPERLRRLQFQQLTVVPFLPSNDRTGDRTRTDSPAPNGSRDAGAATSVRAPGAPPPPGPPAERKFSAGTRVPTDDDTPTHIARPPALPKPPRAFAPSGPPAAPMRDDATRVGAAPRPPTRTAAAAPPAAPPVPASVPPRAVADTELRTAESAGSDGEEATVLVSRAQSTLPTPTRFTLRREAPAGRSGSIALSGSHYICGRSPASDLRLYSPSASREHARLTLRNGVWYLSACEGKTVLANGKIARGEVQLAHGMRLRFGGDEFLVVDHSAVEPSTADEPAAPTSPRSGALWWFAAAIAAVLLLVAIAVWMLSRLR